MSLPAITTGTLLGGRVQYQQFATGHRSGFEPVLLAATIKVLPYENVLEAGTGAGAALLCLGHHVPQLTGFGLEIDAQLAALAEKNFKNNELKSFFAVVGDAATPPFGQKFDHILANPPWFAAASSQSPDRHRALAHHGKSGLLAGWINGLAGCLKSGGSFTFIIPAASASLAAGYLRTQNCGALKLFPLWPRAGMPAKQIILKAVKGGLEADVILPGLVLHDSAGITPEAEAVLRRGEMLVI